VHLHTEEDRTFLHSILSMQKTCSRRTWCFTCL